LSQRIGKVGRAHWVRLILARQPSTPAHAILRFTKLVAKLSSRIRAIWVNAVSKEFDIGIQAGFEPSSAEWILKTNVVDALARLGTHVRITVYPPNSKNSHRLARKRRLGKRATPDD